MTSDKLDSLLSISVWQRGDRRALHKPLVLLTRLAAAARGEPRLIGYEELHEQVARLLIDFGPSRTSIHPEYPFWRLQNDGEFWEIPEAGPIEDSGAVNRSGDVPASVLTDMNARGGFTEDVYQLLREDSALLNDLVTAILDEHFGVAPVAWTPNLCGVIPLRERSS